MSSAAVTGERDLGRVPGWFGKIPALGDFAMRRMPSEFVTVWDDWLQRSLAATADALGAGWLDLYRHSPILRFALLPGLCGASLWAGIVMPSVDRVGRYFPLTIALALEERPGALAAAICAHDWFAALEEVALRTLERDASPEELDVGLAEVGFPWTPGDVGPAAALADWWRATPTAPFTTEVTDVGRLDDLILAGAEAVFTTSGRGRSLWWTRGTGATRLLCFSGLPPAERFVELLGGAAPR